MDKGSLIRTVLLVLALLNQLLVGMGHSPLPISNEQAELLFSTLLTIVMALWAWWKNNYISKKGQKQKEVLKDNNLN